MPLQPACLDHSEDAPNVSSKLPIAVDVKMLILVHLFLSNGS